MKVLHLKFLVFTFFLSIILLQPKLTRTKINDFQGKAVYVSKSIMKLGKWGARLSEIEKKQIKARLKNRLEKTYVLTFNKQESFFKENEKIDAVSGATDSWGKNFTPGHQYKNVKTNSQIQHQEFYGKNFLIKDSLQKIDWQLSQDSKKIGAYTCYKATALIATNDLTWYSFSWSKLSKSKTKDKKIAMTKVEAWYSPQVPVRHGPQEFWGLPGLIFEVSFGNTTLLCSELVLNPKEKIEIIPPKKGDVVTKKEYQEIITQKMQEFRDIRSRRRSR